MTHSDAKKSNSTHDFVAHIEHFTKKNLLLAGIFLALLLAMYAPGPGVSLSRLDLTGFLVGLIFFGQGMELDTRQLKHLRRFVKVIAWGVFVSFVAYPVVAWVTARAFSMPKDIMTGFLIICASPCTLAAGPAIAARARGDALTAIILILTLNFVGLIAFPENLKLWLGSVTRINDIDVILKLIFYLFIPVTAGQGLRFKAPGLVKKGEPFLKYLPVICLALIIYASCSEESHLLWELKFSDVFLILLPSLCVHLFMFALIFLTGRYIFKFHGPQNRAITIICSEKPLTLSVAVWSMAFAKMHPLAIFPIVIFYIVEIVTDSFWALTLARGSSDAAGREGYSAKLEH
jgi:predicted Na+-dependent transporter